MPSELEELIDFLADPRAEVRQQAAQLVEGLTGSGDGISALLAQRDRLLPLLLRLLAAEDATAQSALTALVNLSQDADICSSLVEQRAAGRCCDYLREGGGPAAGAGGRSLLVMLLANLTTQEAGAASLVQLGDERREGHNLSMLLREFAGGAGRQQQQGLDEYAHVADVLTNVTRVGDVRRALLQPGSPLLGALATQLATEEHGKQATGSDDGGCLRHRGCAAALRNCCLGAQPDEEGGEGCLTAILSEPRLLEAAVDLLCGTNGVRQAADGGTREALAEAVLLVARQPRGRKALWEFNAPELLRKGYELEEHVGVCDAMEAVAELFLADNGEIEEMPADEDDSGGADGSSDGAQQQQQQQQQQQLEGKA